MSAKPNKDDVFKQCSRREREVLQILHRIGKGTLTEIADEMESPPTRSALRALMTVMEKKDYVTHVKVSREFVYLSKIPQEVAGRSMLRNIVANFFGGSLKNAVASCLADPNEKLNANELRELAAMMESQQEASQKSKK